MRFTAETRVYLKCKFHPGLHEEVDVRTYGRTPYGRFYQIFLPMVLRCARFARENSANTHKNTRLVQRRPNIC